MTLTPREEAAVTVEELKDYLAFAAKYPGKLQQQSRGLRRALRRAIRALRASPGGEAGKFHADAVAACTLCRRRDHAKRAERGPYVAWLCPKCHGGEWPY